MGLFPIEEELSRILHVCVCAFVVKEAVRVYVPRSCCTLNFNQDRELYWVYPQEIQLKDEPKCQEDAQGKIANSANLNGLVCSSLYINILYR